ncbi:MAG: cob(I)yrinic acid a,c-diamide adenosyltransferase [Candidatus Berkelbacteria bacterium]|nr:cob(I)yrinic acid a,c-diamide adenosyltransferase [Candidatus Berkelbacteria bacterium]
MKSKYAEKGIIISYFGDGKGKTTAALGLALRAAGAGKKTKIIQFIKGRRQSAEEKVVEKIPGVKIEKYGLGFIGHPKDEIPLTKHIKAAKLGLKAVKTALNSQIDILVLDEINWAVSKKLISLEEIIETIKSKPASLTIVLTGRPKISKLIELSDLVTEMKKIKHLYDKGVKAIEGVDY